VLTGLILAVGSHPAAAQEGWRAARSDHFVLAGSADEDEIREVAARLEGFRAVVLRLFAGTRYRSLPPTTVVVLDDEDELKPFDPGGDRDGYFFPGPLDNYIVLVPETRRRKPFPSIFHDYFHAIAAENLPNAPLWLIEGLAEYYSTVDWSSERTHVLMGSPINSHVRLARDEDERLSFEALGGIVRDSPEYDEIDRNRMFYAQSWAFVHFLMTREVGEGERTTARFVQSMASGSSFEEAVEDAFRTGFRTIQAEFANHLEQRGTYPYLSMELDGGSGSEVVVKSQRMPRAEAETYLGNLLFHQGRTHEAEDYIRRAIGNDPTLASPHTLLGALLIRQGKFVEARATLERAIGGVGSGHLSHYHYAVAHIRDNAVLSPEFLVRVRDELREAIRLTPSFPEAYHELALTYLDTREELGQAVQLLDSALDLRPGNQEYLLTLSQILIEQGTFESARTVLVPLLDEGRNPVARRQAEELMRSIEGRRQASGLFGEGFAEISSVPVETESVVSGVGVAPSAEPLPAVVVDDRIQLSRVVSGEQEKGMLSLMDCRDGLTLTVSTESGPVLFHTRLPERIEFASYNPDVGVEISCGPVDPPMPVVVTYRKAPEGSEFAGAPIKVEFIAPR
jgi:Flp pilus assembly protein TadD